jgi:tetratricopeptide (TPR) repeat protein
MTPKLKLVLHDLAAILLLVLYIAWPRDSRAQVSSAPDKTMVTVSKAQNEGRLLDAEKILRDAIVETQEKEPNSPRLGDYLRRLATLVARRGDSSEVVTLNQRALEADRNALGPTDLRVANDLTSMASLALSQGRNQDAEQLYGQALQIVQLHLPHLETTRDIDGAGAVFSALASFYIKEHRTGEAEVMLQQMKMVCDQLPPHPGVALGCDTVPTQLAQLYRSEGRAAEADQEPSVDIGTPPQLAKLDSAAEQYKKDGLYPQAEATYRQAIAWIEANRKLPTGIYLGVTFSTQYYNRLGAVLEKQGLDEQAEATYRGAIELQEAAKTERPASVYGFDFMPLLSFYRAHGRLSEIEPIIGKALELQESVLGANAPRVADTLIALAGVYQEEGRSNHAKYLESASLYQRAVGIEQINAGNDSPQILPVLVSYAGLLREMHQDAQAAEVQAHISAIQKHIERPRIN